MVKEVKIRKFTFIKLSVKADCLTTDKLTY